MSESRIAGPKDREPTSAELEQALAARVYRDSDLGRSLPPAGFASQMKDILDAKAREVREECSWSGDEDVTLEEGPRDRFSVREEAGHVILRLPVSLISQITISDQLEGWSTNPVLFLDLDAKQTADLLMVAHEAADYEPEGGDEG